ncbi:N-acetyltransferase family protein [Bdellovibrio sp. HCB274]|uniref:GNAT family N-acetyltransferase n=1 Tax=Bdellovibrio sp. HCB274 TaxID=3394361 RepID=UPI0039B6D131
MEFAPETVVTKKNKSVTLRSPKVEDAQNILDAMVEVAATSPYILNGPEFFANQPLEVEIKWIEGYLNNPRGLAILAEYENRIVGVLDFAAYKGTKTKHRSVLGISLHPTMRGEGLGELLFKKLLNEIRTIEGLTHVELSMMSENHQAFHLYKKVGFKEFGRRPQAYLQPDGTFCDEVMMVLKL